MTTTDKSGLAVVEAERLAVPMCSVIIPCYHSAATLEACLNSLGRQTFPDFEVILVDSTPAGPAGEDVARRHARCRWYHHPERLGAHAAPRDDRRH